MFENLLDRDHDGRISFDDYYQYLKELNWDDIIEPSWAKPTFEYYDKD